MITTATAGYLSRSATPWFDPSENWTKLIAFRFNSLPGGFSIPWVLSDDVTYANPYIVLSSNSGVSNMFLEAYDGSTLHDTVATVLVNGTTYWLGVRYTAATTTLEFLVDGVVIGSTTVNLAGGSFANEFLLNDGAESSTSSVGYARTWQGRLSDDELLAEQASVTAVRTSNLLSDTPIQASIDLTSHNNTLTQWTAIGEIVTDTDDPLVSVIAGPPTNTTPTNALAVTVDSAVIQDTLASGAAAPETWYKLAVTEDGEYGACAFGDLATFKPGIVPYDGVDNANSNTPIGDYSANENAPIQFWGTAGHTYYFKSERNGAVSPATVQISILKGLDLTVPAGSIAVNDDTSGFPLVFLDPSTGYPIKFIQPFPAGEGACPLTNGNTLVIDLDDTGSLKLIDGTYATLVSIPTTTSGLDRLSTNSLTKFVFSDAGVGLVHQILTLISAAGVVDPTVFDLGAAGGQSVGLNNDASITYYARQSAANTPIQAWDMVNNVALPDLVAGVANYGPGKDIIVLQDGTILVLRNRTGVSCIVTRYDDSGASLSTYDFGDNAQSDNRMATASDDPVSFWTWLKGSGSSTIAGGFSQFIKTKVSDGSTVVQTPVVPQFEDGVYAATVDTTTPVRFGHSESCPFWETRLSIVPPPPPPAPTEHRRIRCVRRFPLPFDRQFWVYVRRIEFLIQAGVGNANPPGDDPQLEVRFSDDGGFTYGNIILVPMGKQGERNLRQVINNIGKLENGWCEVADSDPVRSDLLACFVDAEENES